MEISVTKPLAHNLLFALLAGCGVLTFASGAPSYGEQKPDVYTRSWIAEYEDGDDDMMFCLKMGYKYLTMNGFSSDLGDNIIDNFATVWGLNQDGTLIAMLNCKILDHQDNNLIVMSLSVAGAGEDTSFVFDAYKEFSFE